MLFDDDVVAESVGGDAAPFFAVLLLGLAERLGVTAGNGSNGGGLDGWVIRLDRTVLLLITPAGLWQVETGAWGSWDAPELQWQLLPFAAAADAFERAVAERDGGGEAIVTLARPLLSLPDGCERLASLLASYVPPSGIDAWSRDNRRLYDEIAAAFAALGQPEASPATLEARPDGLNGGGLLGDGLRGDGLRGWEAPPAPSRPAAPPAAPPASGRPSAASRTRAPRSAARARG
jgi:hypothetical protein